MLIDWSKVRSVLVVRLRSIGDTVLSTPSLIALRRFLPEARIDILLEDWVAPVLEGFDAIDNVVSFKKDDFISRLKAARKIRQNKYDVVFNLHGGTTATFFARASGAKHRIGLREYQYNFLYNHLLSSPADFWQKKQVHSAEQQLALLGFVGVPVADKPKSRLAVIQNSKFKIQNYALIHPVAAFETKQWATENFARVAEFLGEKGLRTVAVATKKEHGVLDELEKLARVPVTTFDDLTLPEITALASRAKIFVGNDSGIAHIAAAVETPSVVIFGSSNINHWRPWTNAPNEIVYSKKPCSHQTDEMRKGSENPKCIRCVEVEDVCEAIKRVLPGGILVDETIMKS
ncbi:MAG: glycosyltransferase family 9 protein [Pyrinomonadaceae bacterium]